MAKTYHVSTTGSDAWSGTESRPFRHVQRAADAMQAADTCIIHAGEYAESVHLKASGKPGAPITFSAKKGETVTITGTDPVVGWHLVRGHLYATKWDGGTGKNNQLFFDGKMVDEARWPNRKTSDIFDVAAVKFDSGGGEVGGPGYIVCKSLPDLPDNTWKDAVIWVMAGSEWTSWTATITGYNDKEKKLSFNIPGGWVGNFQHPKDGGEFYLTGNRAALDGPNEWFYDSKDGMLYLWAPDGTDPNRHLVTAKRRLLAFDFSGLSYVVLEGVNVHSAAIDLSDAQHCLIQGIKATYLSHTRGGNTGDRLDEKTGVCVTGSDNTVRDSEIAYSVGNGITLGGNDNRVVNCYVHHTDYMGCFDASIKMSGSRHLISHNTFSDTGRDILNFSGQAHLIQYNEFRRCGLLADDLGFTYTAASDGEGTEIHHNVCHDNLAKRNSSGIYLDNFTSNFLVHHNVVWGTKSLTLQLNRPSDHICVYNNTIIGIAGHWGRWETDRMYGNVMLNNLMSSSIGFPPEVALLHNIVGIPHEQLNPQNYSSGSVPGKDQGCIIPGITDGFNGDAPDIGAFEAGQTPWKAGHDFAKRPEPKYKLTPDPYGNLIKNAGFELGDLEGWTRRGPGKATKVYGKGSILDPASSRNSIIAFSVCLDGDGGIIEQTVTGLKSGTRYTLMGYLKTDGGEVRLGVRDYGGPEKSATVTSREWQHPSLDVTTGPDATSVTVYIRKVGDGSAWADWLGLALFLEQH